MSILKKGGAFMPRPRKCRRVCEIPETTAFGPLDKELNEKENIYMTVDEFETIRLIDYSDMTQEECAKQMGIARTTVQGIYISARKKLAKSLVDGSSLFISGGDYMVCDGNHKPCGKRCHKHLCPKQNLNNNKEED